jgi:hypothetical protein
MALFPAGGHKLTSVCISLVLIKPINIKDMDFRQKGRLLQANVGKFTNFT